MISSSSPVASHQRKPTLIGAVGRRTLPFPACSATRYIGPNSPPRPDRYLRGLQPAIVDRHANFRVARPERK